MLIHRVSTFLSEISTFFKKESAEGAEGAMFTIMSVIKGVKTNEQSLFYRKSRCNSLYSLLHVFQLLRRTLILYWLTVGLRMDRSAQT